MTAPGNPHTHTTLTLTYLALADVVAGQLGPPRPVRLARVLPHLVLYVDRDEPGLFAGFEVESFRTAYSGMRSAAQPVLGEAVLRRLDHLLDRIRARPPGPAPRTRAALEDALGRAARDEAEVPVPGEAERAACRQAVEAVWAEGGLPAKPRAEERAEMAALLDRGPGTRAVPRPETDERMEMAVLLDRWNRLTTRWRTMVGEGVGRDPVGGGAPLGRRDRLDHVGGFRPGSEEPHTRIGPAGLPPDFPAYSGEPPTTLPAIDTLDQAFSEMLGCVEAGGAPQPGTVATLARHLGSWSSWLGAHPSPQGGGIPALRRAVEELSAGVAGLSGGPTPDDRRRAIARLRRGLREWEEAVEELERRWRP